MEGVFRPNRIGTTLATIKRYNVALTPEIGAVNFTHADGSPLTTNADASGKEDVAYYGSHAMFSVEVAVLGMTYIGASQRDFGLDLVRRHWADLFPRQGLAWDMPNMVDGKTGKRLFGTDYYQTMMLWNLSASIAGKDIARYCAPGGLIDRIMRAAVSQEAILPESNAQGMKNAAKDFSEQRNPNGNWSYRDGQGNLIEGSDILFGTAIHAWKARDGSALAWLRASAGQFNLPGNLIASHSPTGSGGPQLWWTAPGDGQVKISGGVSYLGGSEGRMIRARVRLNDRDLTHSAPLKQSDDASIADPLPFYRMSGGRGVLIVSVRRGDVLKFINEVDPAAPAGQPGTFLGFDLQVDFSRFQQGAIGEEPTAKD